MSTFNPAKDIPSDFYTAKTFFTLSGAAASVWIFCLVIGAIFPTDSITPLHYRLIAISLSEIIALLMVLRVKNKRIESWFMAIFNGLLIFINASGWNVITSNNFFSDKNKSEPASHVQPKAATNNQKKAGFQFFKKQIYWWQDNSVFVENTQLKKENKALTEKVNHLNSEISNRMPATVTDCNVVIKHLKDSLLSEINKKDILIRELNSQIAALKVQNNKTAPSATQIGTDTLGSEERKKLLYSMRFLQQQYETKLKVCENEKKELQSKLNMIRGGLDKYGSGLDHN